MKAILPILFILISVVLFIFAVNPLYKEVTQLRADIVVYNNALDNSTNLQKTEDSLVKNYNSIKQVDKDRLNALLPSTIDNIQFILEVERIANLHGMPIKDIKFEAKKKDDSSADPNVMVATVIDSKPYGVFPIEFSTEGRYENFVLFLKDLEYNLRLADVKSISFTTAGDGKGDPDSYQYSVKVETYWLK